jgi:hypothetical protein
MRSDKELLAMCEGLANGQTVADLVKQHGLTPRELELAHDLIIDLLRPLEPTEEEKRRERISRKLCKHLEEDAPQISVGEWYFGPGNYGPRSLDYVPTNETVCYDLPVADLRRLAKELTELADKAEQAGY